MRRRLSRRERLLLRCGQLTTALLLIIWLASGKLHVGRWSASGTSLFVGHGGLLLNYLPPGRNPFTRTSGFVVEWCTAWDLVWVPSFSFESTLPVSRGRMVLPLWILLLTVAIPTGLLRWHGGRSPKGHCQKCGYDLTGNVSGVCPECGTSLGDARDDESSG